MSQRHTPHTSRCSEKSVQVRVRVPTTLLRGKAESLYVRDVTDILRTARLNNYYPDSQKLITHIACMGPEVHRRFYPGLKIDLRSGLPTYREWTRVQTDAEVAPRALESLPSREKLVSRARARPDSIYKKQLLKHDYYTALQDRKLAPLGHLEVALRRVEPENRTAYFRVILDKLDVSGLFLRYTIDLGQTDSAWNCAMVTLTDETAEHTQEFKSLIYKVTTAHAEIMFAKLIAVGGLRVERVVKGCVGPFFFSGMNAPESIRSILRARDGFVATFSLDMATCDLARDRDNDPMQDLMEQQLSEKARHTYHQAREKYGFKVFLDRKFVVHPALARAVENYCQAAGTRNIIYPVKRGKRT